MDIEYVQLRYQTPLLNMELPKLTDDWWDKNPPLNVIAEMQFIDHHKNGKSFAYRAHPDVVSFNALIDGNHLVCGAMPLDGSEFFESGKKYRVQLRLPTGRAYDLNLPIGHDIAFSIAGRDVIALGHIA